MSATEETGDAFTILRSLGFNPTARGLDYAVKGLADRLARTERALSETREMLASATARREMLQAQCRDARAALTANGIGAGETLADGISELASRLADRIESGEVTLP